MKISELMNYIADDSIVLSEVEQISSDKIEEKTMKKIFGEDGYQKKKRMRRLQRRVVGSAAAIVIGGIISLNAYARVNDTTVSALFGKWVFGTNCSQELNETLESMGTTEFEISESEDESIQSVESGGIVVTPIAEVTDGFTFYLQFRVKTPENIVFEELTEGQAYQYMDYDNWADLFPGYTGGYCGVDLTIGDELDNESVVEREDEHTLLVTVKYYLMQMGEFQMPEVFHFEGIWIEQPDKSYTQVLTGSWDIPIDGVKVDKPLKYRLDHSIGTGIIYVTNLAYYPTENVAWNIDISESGDLEVNVILKDGTVIGYDEVNSIWETAVQLDEVEKVEINGVELRQMEPMEE